MSYAARATGALADRTRKLLADHAAQLRLHELSAFCDGEFRDDFDALGPFELCQAMHLKEVPEFGHRGSDLVVASDDERADALSIGRIGHADDRGRGDRRVRIARPFDLLAVDLFAATIDDILDASAKDEIRDALDNAAPNKVSRAISSIGRESFAITIRGVEISRRMKGPSTTDSPISSVSIGSSVPGRMIRTRFQGVKGLPTVKSMASPGSPSRVPVSVPSVIPYW